MNRLYSSPLRVYLLLGALALAGILCGLRLPISLFPNSSKPTIYVALSYGSMTAEEFLNTYGRPLEETIKRISSPLVGVESLEGTYGVRAVDYRVKFKWGVAPDAALKEVQTAVNSYVARLPEEESRNSLQIYPLTQNSGFFALSFYSETRSLDDLYDLLEPLLGPKLTRVVDAQNPILWNPSSKEIRVEPDPGTMASLHIFPRDLDAAIQGALASRSGGSINGTGLPMRVEMPRQVRKPEDLASITVNTSGGRGVHLGDIARISVGPKSIDNQSFKTNGAPSLILHAAPKPGGNVKKMSEDILALVEELMPTLPKDVQYRTLVDPSEFIRAAVNNVFHEVLIAALLAVAVLFLFIGSLRNVITAAIEIPLSMVLAFIMMRLTGMNLNLISLGGLALSAGMNVDASVVVMENIFRHFELNPGKHDFASRLRIVTKAVKEVQFAVIASTIASLVVFLPLTFTSDLSYAILGDLALAVVFSHGFSAIVALILVPTVRLHLMAGGGDSGHAHSPIERQLKWLESTYARLLSGFIARPRLKWSTYGSLFALLALLAGLVIPRLPKEIVGVPDTDWIVVGVSTSGNTLVKQMEQQAEQIERDILRELGTDIRYTFMIIEQPNSAAVMCRLKDKKRMRQLWKALETRFANTPTQFFGVSPWNPSELPIPNPPDMRIAVRGGTLKQRMWLAKDLSDMLQEKKVFPRITTEPLAEPTSAVDINPFREQWAQLTAQGARLNPGDITDLVRVATTGRRSAYLPMKDQLTDIVLRYPAGLVTDVEDIGSIPIGVGSKIVPLKALADISVSTASPPIFREDQRELFLVTARLNQGEEQKNPAPNLAAAKSAVDHWLATRPKPAPGSLPTSVVFEDGGKDLNEAIRQLSLAVALSIALIFLVMLFQFGTLAEPLLVLLSVPLGFIGVLLSLWIFRSTLSLNSILGVILLNGIAVANSIILVDFIKRLVDSGKAPREAAAEAAKQRLRPILITSLTTVLGMLPIAIGSGEGGRILQPLGIAVTGGLWISMGLTLFLVPALQVAYLERREWRRHQPRREWPHFTRAVDFFRRLRPRSATTTTVFLALIATSAFGAETPPAPPTPLSFDEALRRIVERAPSVGIQRETLDIVEAKNLPSRLSLLPTLSASARYDLTKQGPLVTDRRGLMGAVELNIFRFGADVAAMRAASREAASQRGVIADSLLKAEEEGVTALVGVISAERTIEVQRKIVAMWDESLRIAKERYRRGLLAAEEVDKVQVSNSNFIAQLRDSELSLVSSKAQLKSLVNEEVTLAASWPWLEYLNTAPTLWFRDTVDLSLRPDWIAAEQKVASMEQRTAQTFGLMLPSLDLSLSAGYSEVDQRGVGYFNGLEWGGGIVLKIPLFDRLAGYGKYRETVHGAAAAQLELERTKRGARADWETARGVLQVALETAKAREATLATSRRLYETNLRRFRTGLASANELNQDQNRLYESELLAIKGWGMAHSGFSRLCHAIGRRLDSCLMEK